MKMNEYTQQAIDKINEDPKVTDRHYSIIRDGVVAALESFIKQDDEFAQAVVQGGTTEEMFKSVGKKIGSKTGVSDFEVYQSAVEFFFPGAKIEFHMTIDLCGSVREHKTERTSLDLSFDDLFG
jgi:hypothetical protein